MKRITASPPHKAPLRFVCLLIAFSIIGVTVACTSPGATNASIAFTKDNVEAARNDLPKVYDSECYGSFEAATFPECTFVNPEGKFSVYLIGDSHSAQWSSVLTQIAEKFNWKLTIIGKRTCPFSLVDHAFKGEQYFSCAKWNENVQSRLAAEKPDAVITSNYSRSKVLRGGEVLPFKAGSEGEAALANGMVESWGDVLDLGIPLVVIRDTPYLGFSTPDCLLEHLTNPHDCSAPKSDAVKVQPHPDLIAAKKLDLPVVDVTDEICPSSSTCYSAEGRKIIFRDKHHLTATFAAQLSQELENQLRNTSVFASHM